MAMIAACVEERWHKSKENVGGGITWDVKGEAGVTRVNSTNVQYEGLRIGGVGRRMNSKVKSVKQGVYRK
jgi:hypothetical protein